MQDGVTVFLFAILANLAAQVLFSFIAAILAKATGNPKIYDNTYLQLFGMILIQAAYLAVPLVYFGVLKKKRPELRVSLRQKVSPFAPLFALALSAVTLLCFYLPAGWFDTLLDAMKYEKSGGVKWETVGQIVLGIVVMVVFAPCFEELIFRGFLLSGLKSRFGELSAVLLSGLAFSLMHMNPEQTVFQFCLGCVCGWAAVKSGSLLLPVIIHAANNLFAILFDITPLGAAFSAMMNALTGTWYFSVISTIGLFALGVVAVWLLGKAIARSAPPLRPLYGEADVAAEGEKTQKVVMILFVAAIVLCLIMWGFVFGSAMIAGRQ